MFIVLDPGEISAKRSGWKTDLLEVDVSSNN